MDELIDNVPGAETGLLRYPLILIDISVIPPAKFAGHPALRALLETLQRTSEGKLVKEFDRIADYFVPVKSDSRTKDWLHSLARYAMSVAKIGTEQIAKAFSKILNEREAHKMAQTTAQELMTKGKAEGIAVGRAEGKAESGRNMVLTALRTKYKRIPRDIEKSVLAMSDSIALESLLVQAIQSDTLDEFAEALR
jgi:hypothetical protein